MKYESLSSLRYLVLISFLAIRLNGQATPTTPFEKAAAEYKASVAAQTEAAAAHLQIGRYQIVQVTVTNLTTKEQTPQVFKIDTATGKIWVFSCISLDTKINNKTVPTSVEGWAELNDTFQQALDKWKADAKYLESAK